MELHKAIPSLLIKYRFEFAPRHELGSPFQLPPRGLDGNEGDEEPWNCKSPGWFLTPSVSLRACLFRGGRWNWADPLVSSSRRIFGSLSTLGKTSFDQSFWAGEMF